MAQGTSRSCPRPFLATAFLCCLAVLVPRATLAFLRLYFDHAVLSENERFVAEIKFGLHIRSPQPDLYEVEPPVSPQLEVYERKGETQEFRWSAKLFTPISEVIHLSDDGESVVLE